MKMRFSHPIRMVFFANDIMNYCHQVLEVLVPEIIDSGNNDNEQDSNNDTSTKHHHQSNTSSRGMQFNYSRNNNVNQRPSLLPSTFKTEYQQKKTNNYIKNTYWIKYWICCCCCYW